MHRVIHFEFFLVDYAELYINWANTYLFANASLCTSNFESICKKPPFIELYIFSDVILVSDYYVLQRKLIINIINKINTIQYDRYYLQNCKAIIFEDITNHTKYKKTMFQVNFIFFG